MLSETWSSYAWKTENILLMMFGCISKYLKDHYMIVSTLKELLDRSGCALNFEEECSRFLHEKVLLYLFPSSPISLKKPPTNQPNTFFNAWCITMKFTIASTWKWKRKKKKFNTLQTFRNYLIWMFIKWKTDVNIVAIWKSVSEISCWK